MGGLFGVQIWVEHDLPALLHHHPCGAQLRQTVPEVPRIDAIADRKRHLLTGKFPTRMLQQEPQNLARTTVTELLEPEIGATARYQGRGVFSSHVRRSAHNGAY